MNKGEKGCQGIRELKVTADIIISCFMVQILDGLLKEFSGKTNLSVRRIAAITGLNKDKVNKIPRS